MGIWDHDFLDPGKWFYITETYIAEQEPIKMHIVIIATGSRGDVEPYIALGVGLKKAGHHVRLVSHTNYADLINPYGLEFWPVDVNVQDIAQSQEMSDRLGGGNFLKVMSLMAKEAERMRIS